MFMQRARMILPLAWLVRVNDTDLHRGWLAQMFGDVQKRLHSCGPTCGAYNEQVSIVKRSVFMSLSLSFF
jgi:hypothetical protein